MRQERCEVRPGVGSGRFVACSVSERDVTSHGTHKLNSEEIRIHFEPELFDFAVNQDGTFGGDSLRHPR